MVEEQAEWTEEDLKRLKLIQAFGSAAAVWSSSAMAVPASFVDWQQRRNRLPHPDRKVPICCGGAGGFACGS